MFWGSFNGTTLGPCLFWEKEWGNIGSVNYSERIVSLIEGWIRQNRLEYNRNLILMQDGAPGHTGRHTRTELLERGVESVEWPPYWPDLNPIEIVWDKLKNYIANNYPEKLSYDQLRSAVHTAWLSITPELLGSFIAEIYDRCEAVMGWTHIVSKWKRVRIR